MRPTPRSPRPRSRRERRTRPRAPEPVVSSDRSRPPQGRLLRSWSKVGPEIARPVKGAPVAFDYDLLAIGCGPAGQKAAIQASKLGKHSAIAERRQVGGVCVISGTIPSKTLREAVLHLTGFAQRGVYGQSYRVKEEITVDDLRTRYQDVIRRETDVIKDQLARNHVALIEGSASFVDPHTLEVSSPGGGTRPVTAENVVIAVGTRPLRPPSVQFDGQTVFDSDELLEMDRIPGSLV